MAYLATDKDGSEWIYNGIPSRADDHFTNYNSSDDTLEAISIPKGSIEKITNKVITWNDEPLKI